MAATVSDFITILNRLAPPRLAEAWDNVGLQVGHREWPVKTVWVALDPLPEVVAKACKSDVDLLITHHPLFFKPIKQIDCASPVGGVVAMAAAHQMAIFTAHTNLDSVAGGVNDVLAARMGLNHIRTLTDRTDARVCKLVVFAPPAHVQPILDAMFSAGAGRIGNYTHCSFRSEGTGTFFGGNNTSPAAGSRGVLNAIGEHRVEVLVPRDGVDAIVSAAKQVHPYETMAYDVYPLVANDHRSGLGRIGQLPAPLALADFVAQLKTNLQLSTVKIVGSAKKRVKKVAVCSGSGSSLLADAIAAGAEVYVSGDISYHTARDAQQAGIGVIDVGHFHSEQPVVDVLAASLRDVLKVEDIPVVVAAVDTERDPFDYF